MQEISSEMQQPSRMEWLDTAKAFGMVLVYVGHCFIPGWNSYIYLFHMPLFFIISGFLWNREKNKVMTLREFVAKKFKAYIVPYLKIAAVCFVLYGVCLNLFRIGWFTEDYWCQLAKYLFGIVIYSRGTVEWLPQCSPIWFLSCLFVGEVVYFLLMRLRYYVILVVVCGLAGYACSLWMKLPWNIDNALSSIPLLFVGMLYRKYWCSLMNWKVIAVAFVVAVIILLTNQTRVDFDGNYFSNMPAMYVKSGIISLSVLTLICKWGGGIVTCPFLAKRPSFCWVTTTCLTR